MIFSLSRFSIYKQILIGYIPVFVILVFLAYSSFQNFHKFDHNLKTLQNITKENRIFLEIERDIVELQRNVLVYSYVGYQGVLKKVEFLERKLEEKFGTIEYLVRENIEINDRYNRMIGHYNNYKNGFESAIEERKRLDVLNINGISPILEETKKRLQKIKKNYIEKRDFQSVSYVLEIEKNLIQATSNIILFRKFPDSLLVNQTSGLIQKIQKNVSLLKENITDKEILFEVSGLLKNLENYQDISKQIIRANRSYLNLINVVLAGKAAEMDRLSHELDDLISAGSKALELEIKSRIKKSQQQFVLLSLLAGVIGVVSSLIIALGIARPVKAMSITLSDLSKGKSDTIIPGQSRKDEVGHMAKSANKFKIMANNLESQTAELEEFAYRTSHDLRSPLISSISLLGLSQKAIDSEDYAKAKKSMALVSASLTKLETLVTDILGLTKIKNISEDLQKINAKTIINESIEKFSYMENFDRLQIQKNIGIEKKFFSQKSRVVLLVENLISNAVKYQDISKDHSFIKISSKVTKNDMVIIVEDNGLGIPQQQQDQMFSMFKRFHPKTSFGSGLGLYMMQKSIDILGGNITFEDTRDGSKFIVTIPNMAH